MTFHDLRATVLLGLSRRTRGGTIGGVDRLIRVAASFEEADSFDREDIAGMSFSD